MIAQPFHTATVDSWEDVQTYLAEHASASTYTLTALTARHDADLHHIAIDPETRTVWWAFDNGLDDEPGWTIHHHSPASAAETASDEIDSIQDRMDNPEWYAEGSGDLETDQEALDEYAAILLLGLPEEPDRASANIKAKRRAIIRQDALYQRAYVELVRGLAGTERGGKTRAARALKISDMQVGRIIRQDDERREQLAAEVQEIRSTHAGAH